MFSDPIQPRRLYLDRVADGFNILIDRFGTVLALACTGWCIVFGWPFALLSWIFEKRHHVSEPLIVTYMNLLHKHEKEVREFLEQHKQNKVFIQWTKTKLEAEIKALQAKHCVDKTMRCWHCNGKVLVLEDGWVCGKCHQHGAPFNEPATTVEEGRLENKPWQA